MQGRTARDLGPGSWIAVKPKIDPDVWPIHDVYTPDPFALRLRLGIGFGVPALVALAIFALDVSDGFTLLVLGGFALIASIQLMFGFAQIGYRRELWIDDRRVRFASRGLLGRRSFDEPLTAYTGVLLRSEQLADNGVGRQVGTRHYQIIELTHADPARSIPLWVDEGIDPPREVHARMAARLGLPALLPDLTRDGVALAPRGSGAPPLGRVAAMHHAPDPGPPPPGVTVVRVSDRVRLTVQSPEGSAWVGIAAGSLVVIAVAVLLYNLLSPDERWIVILGLLGMIAFMVGVARVAHRVLVAIGLLDRSEDLGPRQELWIDASRIAVVTRPRNLPRLAARLLLRAVPRAHAEARERSVLVDAIEDIRVDRYTAYSSGSGEGAGSGSLHTHSGCILLIDAPDGQLRFGAGHDERALRFVRDFARHAVARHAVPRHGVP